MNRPRTQKQLLEERIKRAMRGYSARIERYVRLSDDLIKTEAEIEAAVAAIRRAVAALKALAKSDSTLLEERPRADRNP